MSNGVEREVVYIAKQGSEWRTPTGAGVGATLVTVMLTLLGYGYALAVESMFGVPESSFADSPLDYLRMSSHVLGHWITGIPEIFVSPAFYVRLYEDYFLVGLVFSVVWLLVVLLWWFARLRQCVHAKAFVVEQRVRSRAVCRAVWRRLSPGKWPVLSLLGIWGWLPAGVWVLGGVLVAVAFLLAAVPLLGFATGKLSLHEWVIEPEICIEPQSRALRLKQAQRGQDQERDRSSKERKPVPGATCVQVRPEGTEEPRQGRLVVSTAHWAVLFDPESGSVWRMSLDKSQVVPLPCLAPVCVAAKTVAPVSSAVSHPVVPQPSTQLATYPPAALDR